MSTNTFTHAARILINDFDDEAFSALRRTWIDRVVATDTRDDVVALGHFLQLAKEALKWLGTNLSDAAYEELEPRVGHEEAAKQANTLGADAEQKWLKHVSDIAYEAECEALDARELSNDPHAYYGVNPDEF